MNIEEIDQFLLETNKETNFPMAARSGFIIISALMNQIENRLLFNRNNEDYLEMIEERMKIINNNFIDDEDIKTEAKARRKELYYSIFERMEKACSFRSNLISQNGIDSIEFENFFEQLKALYNFFILNYKDNLIDFLIYYIIKNKEEIFTELIMKGKKLGPGRRETDLSNFKNKNNDKTLNLILNNDLEDVIDFCIKKIKERMTNEEILLSILNIDPDEINNYILKNLFFEKNEEERFDYILTEDFKETFFNSYLKLKEKIFITSQLLFKINNFNN
jgi:hypothetical protein